MPPKKTSWFKSWEQERKEAKAADQPPVEEQASKPAETIGSWLGSRDWEREYEEQQRRRVAVEEALRQLTPSWWGIGQGRTVTYDPVTGRLQQYAAPAPEEYPTQVEDEVGTSRLVNSHLVGCDPEFVVLNSGRYVSLADYVSADGPIGYDHSGRVAEIRPKPARGTYALTKRIKEMLGDGKLSPVRQYKWRAGAMVNIGTQVQSLGGHIHLDRSMDWTLVKALDRLTVSLERLDILPRAESLNRRRNGGYGHWGDVRTDSGHLEYRVMPSWLFDPRTTFTCLTLAKLVSVDPKLALDCFPARTMSWANLLKFVEAFKAKDINAARWHEKFGGDLKSIQRDPDQNMVEAWAQLGF